MIMTNQKNGYMFTIDRHRLPNTNKKVSKVRNVNNLIKLNQEIKKLYTYFFLLGCIGAAATVILIISIAKMF